MKIKMKNCKRRVVDATAECSTGRRGRSEQGRKGGSRAKHWSCGISNEYEGLHTHILEHTHTLDNVLCVRLCRYHTPLPYPQHTHPTTHA